MKKTSIISSAILLTTAASMTLTGCHTEGTGKTQDSTIRQDSDSIKSSTVTICGHLGEDTGMSVLEFITDDGDTLYINRTDEHTGKDGQLTGSIRNYTDRYRLQLTPDSQTLISGVNLTEQEE